MSISVTLLSPQAGSLSIGRDTPFALRVSTPGEVLDEVHVTLNGLEVYRLGTGKDVLDLWPDVDAHITRLPDSLLLILKRRRMFEYGEQVTVVVRVSTNHTTNYAYSTTFTVAERAASLYDKSLARTKFDTPFTTTPAIEALRSALHGILLTNGSFMVALFHSVKASRLYPLLHYRPLTLEDELLRLTHTEITSVIDVVAIVDSLDFLWPTVLKELDATGVSPSKGLLLDESRLSTSPQERVGAACAAVLLAGELL